MSETMLDRLAEALIEALTKRDPGTSRGTVLSRKSTPPYRRIDCDRRVFAYLRVQPRNKVVRLELSVHFRQGRTSRLQVENKDGPPVIALRTHDDIPEAMAYLLEAILATRHELHLRQKRSV